LFGLSRQLEATTGANGVASFDFGSFWTPSALIVLPAGEFWSVVVRGPANNLTVDCPRLPVTGPLAWWHHLHGIAAFDPQRGAGIRVGVADTGVGPHPCLSHAQDIGAFIDGDTLPTAGADVDSHGSHVCGTIGARPLNAGQFAGIAPGVTLISARVFPPNSGANQGDIVNAIDALSRTHQADLINLSLGAPQASQIEQDALRDALQRGTLCICAAANSAGPVEWPAAFPETVAVSALGLLGWGPAGTLAAGRVPEDAAKFGVENLYLANFSCFGPEITCGAPGVGIISTVPARFSLVAPYASMDGTSMASPSACGALAALLAVNADYRALPRDETRAQMARMLIQQHCRDIGLQAEFQGKGVADLQ
jgi:subtilisin